MINPELSKVIDLYIESNAVEGTKVLGPKFEKLKRNFSLVQIILEKLQFIESLKLAFLDLNVEVAEFSHELSYDNGDILLDVYNTSIKYTPGSLATTQHHKLSLTDRIDFLILSTNTAIELIKKGPICINNLAKLHNDLFTDPEKEVLQALQINLDYTILEKHIPLPVPRSTEENIRYLHNVKKI